MSCVDRPKVLPTTILENDKCDADLDSPATKNPQRRLLKYSEVFILTYVLSRDSVTIVSKNRAFSISRFYKLSVVRWQLVNLS